MQSKNRLYIISAIAVILIICLFTSYQMLSKKYSEEVTIEQFKEALIQKDKLTLKTLIQPSDSRIKVNDQSLDALFALIDKNPSLIQEIEASLRNESLANKSFYLRTDGKHFGLFNRNVIDTPGYFISVKSTGEQTKIYLGESEIGVLEESDASKEFGPFLTGSYAVKGVYTSDTGTKEDKVTLDLAGAQTTTETTMQTESSNNEGAEEKTIVREVIREVQPSSSYYLIPNSDYKYLTYDDIAGLSQKELRLARNEIYARHGYIFNSKDLQNYFSSQSWYSPNPNYSDSDLSAIEKANVDFLKLYE